MTIRPARRKSATNGQPTPAAAEPRRVVVGQLTIAEGDEIKARQEMVKRLRQQAQDLAFAAAAVEESVGHYLRAALRSRGLSGEVEAQPNGDLVTTVPPEAVEPAAVEL